jgi:hypothetical protein
MSTCNRLDLETLGSKPIIPKISPDTEFSVPRNRSFLIIQKPPQIWGLDYHTADFFFEKCGLWLSRFQLRKPLNLVMCVGGRDG